MWVDEVGLLVLMMGILGIDYYFFGCLIGNGIC
jgi:hypothetical protein